MRPTGAPACGPHDDQGRRATGAALRVWLHAGHGAALLDLPYELCWATTWMGEAYRWIAPVVGLPELPFVDFGDRLFAVRDDTVRTHPQAAVIECTPGVDPILGAESLVAAGDLAAYPDAGHLASAAGLVPLAKDSGRRTGNLPPAPALQPPPAQSVLPLRTDHIPAVIALARRRVDVLWALLRDNRPFTTAPPTRTAPIAAA
jgi:hypothetical protein